MNIIRKEQDFWKVKNTTDDCVMSLVNSGNLQAQAALDAPVYYYHPDLLGLVGPRHGSAIHWDLKKRSMRFWGKEEG